MSDTQAPEVTTEPPVTPPDEIMTYVQFWLTVGQKEKLRKLAAKRDISMSEAIRRALNPYLSKVK